MSEAFIVDAVRTPVGKKGGSLAEVHPATLAGYAMTGIIERNDIDPSTVDDVIFGTVDMLGPNAANVTRTAWLAAGYPESVPATTVDRQCGSSQQAIHFAAQAVMSDSMDLVLAGGSQNMSIIPFGHSSFAAAQFGHPDPWSGCEGYVARYGDHQVNQFVSADEIAKKWGIARDEMELFAWQSHERAVQAIDEGRFDNEIIAVGDFTTDEGPRRGSTIEKMQSLQPIVEGTDITAALSSQMSDASSAVLIANERALEQYGLKPRARIKHMTVAGDDMRLMLTGPIAATHRAIDRGFLNLDEIDLVEINEAFVPVAMAWEKEFDFDHAKVNVNGGAVALGHPIGATGAKLMSTLLNELERTGGRYGLLTVCENGGLANLTVIERV